MKTPSLILILILILIPPAFAQELHHNATFTGTTTISGVAITVPASGQLVGIGDTQNLTNKTIDGLSIVAGTGTSLTLGTAATLTISGGIALTFNAGTSATVGFGNGGTVVYTSGSQTISGALTLTGANHVGSGGSLTGDSGSTITISGALAGTPTGGTLNLSNLTLTLPAAFVTTTATQTLTNKTLAAASNTLTYARSGSGMASRTLNAEIDETPITSLGAGAAMNWNGTTGTNDTANLQRELDSKKLVRFSMASAQINAPLTISTIGQLIQGAGIPNAGAGGNGTQIANTQTTSGSGQDGIHWYETAVGSDILPDQGGHADFASFRDFSLRANTPNTGIGMDLGTNSTYSGDYNSLSNLYIEHFETGIHLKGMGNTRLWNVAVTGQSGTPSDYGVKFDGGSSNSHFLFGLSCAYCNIGLDLNTPGQGNVYFLGDFGQNGTHVKEEVSGAGGIFIGGNFEDYQVASNSGRSMDLQNGSTTVLIEAGTGNESGNQTNEAILVGGNNIINIGHTAASTVGSLMEFQGQGFISLSPSLGVDTVGTTTMTVAGVTLTSGSAAVTVTSGNTNGLTVGEMILDTGVTVTANLTASSNVATCANTAGLVTGGFVRGFGIPANTTISSIITNISFTMSANAVTTYAGASVTETLIPYGTTISAVGSSSALTLSANAGASATGVGLTEYLKWHQSVFPSIYDNGLPTATMSNRGVIWQLVSRGPFSTVGDNLLVSRMNIAGVPALGHLVAETLLEQANTWVAGTQTFSNPGGPTLLSQSYLTGSVSSYSEGGALCVYGDPGSSSGPHMAFKQKTSTDASIDLAMSYHDYSVAGGDARTISFWPDHTEFRKAATFDAAVTVTGGVLHLTPIARPGSASAGDIYVDSGDTHTYEYNGTAWKQLDN